MTAELVSVVSFLKRTFEYSNIKTMTFNELEGLLTNHFFKKLFCAFRTPRFEKVHKTKYIYI